MLHEDKSDLIIKAFYKVYNNLGYGFLEKVYHNALLLELQNSGFKVTSQYPINVYYEGAHVGEYFADIVVDSCIIIEIKATEFLRVEHEYQLINYLKATDMEVGLLLNFGKTPAFKRKYYTNNLKADTGKQIKPYEFL